MSSIVYVQARASTVPLPMLGSNLGDSFHPAVSLLSIISAPAATTISPFAADIGYCHNIMEGVRPGA